MYYTTLKQLRKFHACEDRYWGLINNIGRTLTNTSKISMLEILETNGIVDAIWALRTLKAKKLIVCFAADCAESVLHFHEKRYPEDDRPRKAIEAVKSGNKNASIYEAAYASAYAAAAAAAYAYSPAYASASAAAYAAAAAYASASAAAYASASAAAYAYASASAAAYAAAYASASAAAYAYASAYAAAAAAAYAYEATEKAERKIQEKFYRKYFCKGCK